MKRIEFTNTETGEAMGSWAADANGVTPSNEVVASILDAAIPRLGPEGAWATYSSWTNGYCSSAAAGDETKARDPRDGDGDGWIDDGKPTRRRALDINKTVRTRSLPQPWMDNKWNRQHAALVPVKTLARYREYEVNEVRNPGNLLPMADDILTNGFREPAILQVDYRGHALLGEGNHRLAAAELAGLDEIPVRVWVVRSEHGTGKLLPAADRDRIRAAVDAGHVNQDQPPSFAFGEPSEIDTLWDAMDEPVVSPTMRNHPHQEAALADILAAADPDRDIILDNGSQGTVEVHTGPLGSVVVKDFAPRGWNSPDARSEATAEILAAAVAEAMGVPAPRVERYPARKHAVVMDYIPSDGEEADGFYVGADGARMRLFDWVVVNSDRHSLNVVRSDWGDLVAIDHGYTSNYDYDFPNNPDARRRSLGAGARRVLHTPEVMGEPRRTLFSRSELEGMRDRLEALKPLYLKTRPGKWGEETHAGLMARMDLLIEEAT